MPSSAARFRRALPMVVLLALAAAGCTGTVPMQAAPTAAAVGCAAIVTRLPSDVVGLAERETDAQGTGAWGEPAQVLLRCGVPDPGPSAACITERDVDWTIDDSDAAVVVATSYGRDPVVEVVLDAGLSGGREILAALAPAVSSVPATRRCS
ncbi:DUF3515 domain-containing protein [Rathayibacter sp. VKM Ac-2929]|uniref:DUF3515 family protein n=1 Tax=Rathayibacter sp. VKM Ac-2929 TaxID=2929480 RepID=UPI001FB1E0E4|nr:DUF3515 family protein [Rathayibacter sp. VKM Ac-2929]MCJ1674682.1 DUF3515 domain-containing protein [Rathayibacter sp. VKM Ac-2929]